MDRRKELDKLLKPKTIDGSLRLGRIIFTSAVISLRRHALARESRG